VKTGNEEGGWRRGDVVGAKGKAFVTKKGELSLLLEKPEDVWVVSPCMWMLPEYSSLKDNEVRYRNKHLDLITNPESLQMVKLRSKIISTLREELIARDYIEVETPTLSPSAGGAIAVYLPPLRNLS
jgi:lysyl-tRNA synthetase class 2